MKGAAATLLTLDPDPAAHQLHEALRNRETEAGPAIPPGRRAVGLGEVFENQRLLRGRDADARVADLKVQLDAAWPRLRASSTLTTISPRSVNFNALPTRLMMTWARRPRSPRTLWRHVLARCRRPARPPSRARATRRSGGPRRRHRRTSKSVGSRSTLPASILEKSRMSLMSASRAWLDSFTTPRHSRCSVESVGVERELRHADDAVHRRANLVAHVREEITLRPVRALGLVLGGLAIDDFLLEIARAVLDEADELALAMTRAPDLHLVGGHRRADEGHERESQEPARLVEMRHQTERDRRAGKVPDAVAVGGDAP